MRAGGAQYGGPVPNLTINTNNTGQQAAAETGNSGAPLFPNGNYPYSSFGYDQFAWFLNDIARVDRGRTPWVIVAWHQPPYNSYSTHYKEFECERQHIEPFLYANGVDIVMHGHVHAYERTFPVNNYTVDPCGMRWITIGDGGNIEGLYKTFAAESGTCTCTASNGDLSSNGCPCQGVAPSTQPQVGSPLRMRLADPSLDVLSLISGPCFKARSPLTALVRSTAAWYDTCAPSAHGVRCGRH